MVVSNSYFNDIFTGKQAKLDFQKAELSYNYPEINLANKENVALFLNDNSSSVTCEEKINDKVVDNNRYDKDEIFHQVADDTIPPLTTNNKGVSLSN